MEDEDEDFVNIDENNLDKEWVGHPKRFYKYAIKLAEAKLLLTKRKAEKELMEATLSDAIRKQPAKFDLPKVTEASVESCLLMQPDYQRALSVYNKQQYRVDILSAAVSALEHRKRALESLVSLHGQNYFSAPKADREVSDTMEKSAVRRPKAKPAG